MRLRRKGRYWYLRIRRRGDDTEIATRCTTRAAAEAFARRWELDDADPEGATRRRASAVTVAEVLDEEAARHDEAVDARRLAPASRDFYRTRLGTLLRVLGAKRPAREIDARRVDALIAQRRSEGASDHTIHKELAVLRRTLAGASRAERWMGDVDAVMPARFAPSYTPRDRWITHDDLVAVLAELPPGRAAWLALAAGAGAEKAALALAERGDFDAVASTVLVRGTKNTRRQRVVPLVLPQCRALVERAFAHGDGSGDRLLRTWNNLGRDVARACRRVGCRRTGCEAVDDRTVACPREACRAAAVEPFSLHVLRHSFATWQLAAGASFDDVARALGHAGTTMLHRVYGHLTPAMLADRLRGAFAAREGA